MPKASHSKLVLCKCQSHCTRLNPGTGKYEGDGHWIPGSTRGTHQRDDRRARGAMFPEPTLALGRNDLIASKLGGLQDEISWLASLPISSTNRRLDFTRNPLTEGPYSPPRMDDMLKPNHGIFSLKSYSRVNQTFLMVENRCCQIVSILVAMTLEHSGHEDKRTKALAMAYDSLIRLSSQKGIHWSQYRVQGDPNSIHPIIVNTGTMHC